VELFLLDQVYPSLAAAWDILQQLVLACLRVEVRCLVAQYLVAQYLVAAYQAVALDSLLLLAVECLEAPCLAVECPGALYQAVALDNLVQVAPRLQPPHHHLERHQERHRLPIDDCDDARSNVLLPFVAVFGRVSL